MHKGPLSALKRRSSRRCRTAQKGGLRLYGAYSRKARSSPRSRLTRRDSSTCAHVISGIAEGPSSIGGRAPGGIGGTAGRALPGAAFSDIAREITVGTELNAHPAPT